jgi:hypothetical protein
MVTGLRITDLTSNFYRATGIVRRLWWVRLVPMIGETRNAHSIQMDLKRDRL